nr:TIGR01777 family protein [Actinomycetales bacterium]
NWTTEYTEVEHGTGFTDSLVQGPLRSWKHHHSFEDLGSTTRVRDEIKLCLPRRAPEFAERSVATTMARLTTYRQSQLLADLEFAASHPGPPLRIAVSGAGGLIGTQLTALLSTLGHTVVPIVRSAEPVTGAVAIDPARNTVDEAALAGTDVVIHLAGEPIAGRFTEAHKRRIADSRTGPTAALARAAAASGSVRTFVSASAVGYYGADPAGTVNEESAPGDDFLARVCTAWEDATEPAAAAGLRVAMVRTGIVLTPAGGTLATLLPLYRIGAGGPVAGGTAWQSWISIDDVVGAFAHAALDHRVAGPVNAVAPRPSTSREFADLLGRILSRPSAIPVPPAGPAVLLGREGARLLANASQQVSADKLCASGYEFRHPTLGSALRHVLGQEV